MVSRKKLNALILGVLLSSLFGYLEYGQGMSVFLFQAEKDALVQLVTNTKEAIHPFVLLPMLGQLLLILVLFQKKPNRWFIYFGILGMVVLLGFIFVVGCIALQPKMVFSTVPFLIFTFLLIQTIRRFHKSE
jgi:hypothetical protein